MAFFLTLPEQVRAAIIFVIVLVIGGQVNRGIYRLAWSPRAIDPWGPPHPKAAPRTWWDCIPVIGWFRLQREEKIHGSGFWVRPLLLEVFLAAGIVMLYLFEIRQGLVHPLMRPLAMGVLHQQFLVHAILIVLMTVATFIDFDEKTIPDSITIPGALLALILAAIWPMSRLTFPYFTPPPVPGVIPHPLQLAAPNSWPAVLHGGEGLLLGCGALCAWCWGMVPTLCTLRRGWINGVRFYLASFFRGNYWQWMLGIAIVGCAGIAYVWNLGGARWEALLTQLTGLFFGGLLVWSVRVAAGMALRKEAMGFGDVTLMAMIGAFLGWQATLLIFFLSPVGALVVSLTQWLSNGRRDIAFGPYLCLAAVLFIVGWIPIWERTEGVFSLGWLVPALVAACLGLMTGLLMMWRIVEDLIHGPEK